jgi:hypothetical protein
LHKRARLSTCATFTTGKLGHQRLANFILCVACATDAQHALPYSDANKQQGIANRRAAMMTFTSVFQRFFGAAQVRREEKIEMPAKTHAMQEAEDTREFLLSIAHLPAPEREKRIHRREAIKQIVARHGIMEAETEANNYWKR